jgi:toxin-antitoxin system PIN domain toxin
VRFLIDTNILLHAANAASPAHRAARGFFAEHLRSRTSWCITWPILYEFFRMSTHARVFPKPLTAAQALEFAGAVTAREEVVILVPTSRHLAVLETVVKEIDHPAGNLFHDIHIAVLMREHGIPEIMTADADFLQFSFLKVTNPLR